MRMPVATCTRRKLAADPDVRLMLRVQQDDAAAFAQLLSRHSRRVFQQIYLMVGNREEAEDLTQDVFLRVFRHRKSYQPKAKFTTWLYHIVRNIARNALRDRRRRPAVPMLSAREGGSEPGLDQVLADRRAETPSAPLERLEARRVVRTALTKLVGRQRTALELQQFHDQTYRDIAKHLAMSPQAAKSLLYRARNQLRAELASYVQSD